MTSRTFSLSVNHLPSKFSSGNLVGGEGRRLLVAAQDNADLLGVQSF